MKWSYTIQIEAENISLGSTRILHQLTKNGFSINEKPISENLAYGSGWTSDIIFTFTVFPLLIQKSAGSTRTNDCSHTSAKGRGVCSQDQRYMSLNKHLKLWAAKVCKTLLI